jgi:hypothetical protein
MNEKENIVDPDQMALFAQAIKVIHLWGNGL